MIERKGILQFKEQDVSVIGIDLDTGIDAPEFRVTDKGWHEISALKATQGKVRILTALPSLDTSVCERETRRFNQEAATLGTDIVIMAISTDLPFAQARWCAAEGIDQVQVVSDHKYTEFGLRYSCLLSEPRILRRAVFIVDKENILRYSAYMPALKTEPDYEEVLNTAKAMLNK